MIRLAVDLPCCARMLREESDCRVRDESRAELRPPNRTAQHRNNARPVCLPRAPGQPSQLSPISGVRPALTDPKGGLLGRANNTEEIR
jgi:hypothetical protein